MKWLKYKYLLLVSFILVVSIFGFIVYSLFVQEKYVVIKLNAGPNREIVIWADWYFEICQPLYYEVKTSGQTISPISFIDCKEETPSFSLLYSKDRHLIGVVEDERPEILVVLNDFASGETWSESKDSNTGKRLRDKLNIDNSELNLKLSSEVP